MFGWKRKQPEGTIKTSAVRNLIDVVLNAGSTLTWANLYGVLNHEKTYNSQNSNALKLSAVKCAMDIYTGMIVGIPRRMYALESGTLKKTRVVDTTQHPASRMFSHYFHPELTADEALLQIIYDILMDGNCYYLREMDGQGRTSRGYYIHPSRIPRGNIFRASGSEDLYNKRKAVKGELVYRIDSGLASRDQNAEHILVPRSDMIHFKGKVLDAENHCAQGFVSNSTISLELYKASEEFGWRFYSRGIATQMFLTTDNRLAPDVLKRIESNFNEDPNAPLEDIFKTRILEQGLKPVHMGIPFQHLQFIETRAFSVEDVARGLNIPPALLHSYMGTKAGDVDLSAAVAMFVQTGIGPLLSRIASQFRTELLSLPSQMLFSFEFELLYLYRSVIDKFTTSLRNLFEIGMIDRQYGAGLLGMHIDPNDPANNLRYVPVNLMTVDHSLQLQEQAKLSNENQKMVNDSFVGPEQMLKLQAENTPPPKDPLSQAPDKNNIDKRLRASNKAFLNVINGLKQYEARVLEQKKASRPDDYNAAVNEFYAADSKFYELLGDQLLAWNDILTINNLNMSDFRSSWVDNKSCPEGVENGITYIES
jgi:HK97 family phage portal protein